MQNDFDVLKRLVADAEKDIGKADAGQNAAGTRLRKAMGAIKGQAQLIRKRVLERREAASKDE